MDIFINSILSGSAVCAICWLWNKIDERKFCKKAGKEANRNYIELQKAKKKK